MAHTVVLLTCVGLVPAATALVVGLCLLSQSAAHFAAMGRERLAVNFHPVRHGGW